MTLRLLHSNIGVSYNIISADAFRSSGTETLHFAELDRFLLSAALCVLLSSFLTSSNGYTFSSTLLQ